MFLASGFARGLIAVGAVGLFAAGCGDGPICPSEIVLVIQSPADAAELTTSNDNNANEAGIQTDVTVRSNLKSGNAVTLTITADGGSAVEEVAGTSDADGNVTFAGVTLPAGGITLAVSGTSDCGTGGTESTVTVVTEADCALTIVEGPITNDFFAPIPVLNSSNDSDAAMPNFQANFSVETAADFDVEVFVLDIEAGNEASVGTKVADSSGVATFQATLAQGRQAIRATCKRGSLSEASATSTVQVDTVVPTCSLTTPEENVTVTPDHDEDENAEGIQQFWRGTVDDGTEDDTLGQSSSFFRDTSEFAGTAVDADGNIATAALAEFTAPGTFAVRLLTHDNAGNNCEAGFDARVVMDGCSITIDSPTTTVVTDSDAGTDGVQADFVVQVGTECAGQEVFVDCGPGEVSAIAPANGTTPISDVTISATTLSEGTVDCTARVVSTDNYQTSALRSTSWDTLAPSVALNFVDPVSLDCGQVIAMVPENDVDSVAAGFQIDVSVTSPLADVREIVVINGACAGPTGCVSAETGFQAPIRITLEPGDNDIQAVVRDASANEASSGACNVTLADIAVAFDATITGGVLNRADGTVNGANLDLLVCGTVSENNSTVIVRVDDTTDYPTTINTGAWCTIDVVVLTETAHNLVATATTNDSRTGSVTAAVTVDITNPANPAGLTAIANDRQSFDASWDTSADVASFIFRYSEAPFGDFFTEGTELTVNATTSVTVSQLDIGTSFYVGVAAVDAAGNISTASTVGPVIPLLDGTGGVASPDGVEGDGAFGSSVVTANFNGDAYDDIVVGAMFNHPGGEVATDNFSRGGAAFVYFGTANGIGTVPDVTINGPIGDFFAGYAEFGRSMTAINWGGGAEDGIAIGAPWIGSGAGGVYIFHDTAIVAAAAGSGVLSYTDADMSIEPDPTANWFSGSRLGWSVAAGQVDGAGPEDLVIGAILGGGVGGATIIYGGTPTQDDILLSDTDNTGLRGLNAHLFENPVAAGDTGGLGATVSYLGDTDGDNRGDVAISYIADDTDLGVIDDQVYVLRGRAILPSGMEAITVGAADLVLQHTSADASTSFGRSVASINGDNNRDIIVTARGESTGVLWIVSGDSVGNLPLTDTTGFITRIVGGGGNTGFAGGVANNAVSFGDINDDGVEDLLVAGGAQNVGEGVTLYIWLGDEIPTGNSTSASASHSIASPVDGLGDPDFLGATFAGDGPLNAISWVGDVNGDNLLDICWVDAYRRATDTAVVAGRIEILWDDGL